MNIKKIIKGLYPKPLKIKEIGVGSVVKFPRKIQGARAINIGDDVIIQSGSWLATFSKYEDQNFAPNIKIGSNIRIGRQFMLTAIDSIEIGDGCLFSEQVFISDHYHMATPQATPPHKQPLASKGPVKIGKNCFLGIRACVFSGVTLGDYCVVGANSVVTKSFPAYSIIAGAPARLVGNNNL
ncbi:acyltransferase [Collimonas pratensis]|uniref:acyltransferase n=1 Tax=Collimonas pratensis TaxID=279113 RepID=UPI00143D8E7A|nr:acyltransferase [Collimonas pratensis]NKI67888.1 acyltransferase [Collimonas pratensis]